MNPKEYLQSFLSISSIRDNIKFKNLRLMKSKTAWLDIGTLSLIDAVYYPLRNAIGVYCPFDFLGVMIKLQ